MGPIVEPRHLSRLNLVELFAELPDPRKPRGVRHKLASIMTCALAAVLSGAHSYAAIGQWAKESPDALSRLGVRGAPEASTFRRVLSRLDADWFDALAGLWTRARRQRLGGRTVISFDGKTIRGAKTRSARAPHLLSALAQGTDAVIAQTAVDAKTNEIPCPRSLLGRLDIADCLIVADALHAQRDTAELIIGRQADYLLTTTTSPG
jgi:hypothetical protein